MSPRPPDLHLSVDSLCSKWGFNDGAIPDELLDYWGEDFSTCDVDWHHVLRTLVRSHLVPAMEAAGHRVAVYDVETNHNPIRAASIDDNWVDDYSGVIPVDELRCESVTVPYEDVARACGRLPQRPARPQED